MWSLKSEKECVFMSTNITINPSDFAPYRYSGKVHPRSIYDFTFENRYVIYHYTRPFQKSLEFVYEYLDTSTHRKSQLFVRPTDLSYGEIPSILPALRFATQYKNNYRYTARSAV